MLIVSHFMDKIGGCTGESTARGSETSVRVCIAPNGGGIQWLPLEFPLLGRSCAQ